VFSARQQTARVVESMSLGIMCWLLSLGLLAATFGTPVGPVGPATTSAKRWFYEQSILNCSSSRGGFGMTGDVIIRVRRENGLSPAQSRSRSVGGQSAGAAYAQKLLARKKKVKKRRSLGENDIAQTRGGVDEEDVPDVEVRAVYEEVIDGVAAHLSEEKLEFVLGDDEVETVEADCVVRAR
jgi:hypothetical protein